MRIKSDLIITDLTEQTFDGQQSVLVCTTTVLEKGRPVMKVIQNDGASVDIVTYEGTEGKIESFRSDAMQQEPCCTYMERFDAYMNAAATTISWEAGFVRESTIGQPDLWSIHGKNHIWTILIGVEPIITLNLMHDVQGIWGEPAVVGELRRIGIVQQPPMMVKEL